MAEKVYVLEEPTRPPTVGVKPAPAPAPSTRREQPPFSRPLLDEVVEEQPQAWIKVPMSTRRPLNALGVVLAVYTLGGVAPLALRMGKRKFLWAALSLLSLATWVTLAWHWGAIHGLLVRGSLPAVPFVAGLLLASSTGVVSWCRALWLAGRDERYRPERLPVALRTPWIAAVLGIFVPGVGLLSAGRAVRAALAFWNAACASAAFVVVSRAGFIWSWNARAGADSMPRSWVECLLAASAAVAVLGGLMWIASALDGARLVVSRPRSARARAQLHGRAQGDLAAVGLLLAMITFVATFRPAQLARDADRFAGAMRLDGFQVIPLWLEASAARLDAGRPEYAMRMAEIEIERGNRDAARAIHENLRQRWESYARMLLHEDLTARAPLRATPIEPGAEIAPHGATLPKLTRIPPAAEPSGSAASPSSRETEAVPAPAAPKSVESTIAPPKTTPAPSAATPPAIPSVSSIVTPAPQKDMAPVEQAIETTPALDPTAEDHVPVLEPAESSASKVAPSKAGDASATGAAKPSKSTSKSTAKAAKSNAAAGSTKSSASAKAPSGSASKSKDATKTVAPDTKSSTPSKSATKKDSDSGSKAAHANDAGAKSDASKKPTAKAATSGSGKQTVTSSPKADAPAPATKNASSQGAEKQPVGA